MAKRVKKAPAKEPVGDQNEAYQEFRRLCYGGMFVAILIVTVAIVLGMIFAT